MRHGVGATGNTYCNTHHYNPKYQEYNGAGAGKLGAYTCYLSAMRTTRKRVVQCIEQKCVVTMGTGDAAHARHVVGRG